jgi:hypothetical protein
VEGFLSEWWYSRRARQMLREKINLALNHSEMMLASPALSTTYEVAAEVSLKLLCHLALPEI